MNTVEFPVKEDNEIVYSLFIENPKNPNIGDTVQFENREKMDVYIEMERKYTINELKALYRAITKTERDKAKDRLRQARFSFLSEVIKATETDNEAG